MSKYKYLIGIDPGVKNFGIAHYSPGSKQFIELKSGIAADMFMYLHKLPYKNSIFVIELPAKAFIAKGDGAVTMATNVGKNWGIALFICQYFDKFNIPYLTVNPKERQKAYKLDKTTKEKVWLSVKKLKRPTKTNYGQFTYLTGHNGSSSEHSRDAATLVYQYTIKQVELLIQIQRTKSSK